MAITFSRNNNTNIYKIVKSATIENGLKRALATGDFGIKQNNSNKVGVAQVLNRLTYISSLSHLRRVNTPIDKSGKLIPPRKLHNTQWGIICPSETPEGGSVGLVKNLSIMTYITNQCSEEPIVKVLNLNVNPENPRNGFFELDWNAEFVNMLKQSGYQGQTEEEIVDRWFQTLCRTIGNEQGLDVTGSGYVQINRRDDGKTEVS